MNPATDKGIWQVRPVQYNWDHLDFVGLDDTDYKRDGKELGEFYQSLINNMMRVEEKDGVAKNKYSRYVKFTLIDRGLNDFFYEGFLVQTLQLFIFFFFTTFQIIRAT